MYNIRIKRKNQVIYRKVVFLMEYKFTSDNFQQEVLESKEPVMIDFYADWCGPCQMMGPVVANLAEEYAGKVKVGKVNTDAEPQLAKDYQVMSIPNFVFIKDGKVVDQAIGAVSADALKEKLEALL